MSKRRRNFNAPVRHRAHLGLQRRLVETQPGFLQPKELAVSLAWVLRAGGERITEQQARALQIPLPLPVLLPVKK